MKHPPREVCGIEYTPNNINKWDLGVNGMATIGGLPGANSKGADSGLLRYQRPSGFVHHLFRWWALGRELNPQHSMGWNIWWKPWRFLLIQCGGGFNQQKSGHLMCSEPGGSQEKIGDLPRARWVCQPLSWTRGNYWYWLENHQRNL